MASPSSPAHPASTRALSSTSSPANQWACFPSATEVPAEYKISPRYTPVADLSSPVSIMTDAYLHHLDASASDSDELDSLPSISSSVLDSEPDSDAQAEWERSLEQMQLLLTMIIVPFAGKYFGRKFAYWSWGRYMEWMHNVEITWTNKAKFKAVGVAEAAAAL